MNKKVEEMSKKRKSDDTDVDNARKLASIVQSQPLATTLAPAQPLETPLRDVAQPTSLLFTTPSSTED